MTDKVYTLYTSVDHKSKWIARITLNDYKVVEKMRNHYRSKNFLTKIVKEKCDDPNG